MPTKNKKLKSGQNKRYRIKYFDREFNRIKEHFYRVKLEWLKILREKDLLHCVKCGYDLCFAALDYHHIIPGDKKMTISRIMTRIPFKNGVDELDRVICLCSRCHRELHNGLWKLN